MSDLYQEDWNRKRIKAIIDHYGHKAFYGKRILDLGAYNGDIAIAFARLGAEVLCIDVRQENINEIEKKYKFLRTIKMDLDQDWISFREKFDFVFSLDCLCHLKDYERHIKNICCSAEHIVLETEVLDSSDANAKITLYEDKMLKELSICGEGSIASPLNIENKISEMGGKFKRIKDQKINSRMYKYDWSEANTGRSPSHRGMWFIHIDTHLLANFRAREQLKQAEISANIHKPVVFEQKPIITTIAPPIKPGPIDYFTHQIENNFAPNNDSKIRLFFNYYEDKRPERKKEIDFCLQKNLDNNMFETIIINSDDNPTYKLLFEKINDITGNDDINIICNSDIFFDETVYLANKINHKQVYALTCWDWINQDKIIFRNVQSSQDTWIVRGKIENVFGDFQLGKWSCDNRIAYEFHKAKYKVFNPSKSIRSYHYHNSGIRSYNLGIASYEPPSDAIPGPHLFVIPTEINN